MPVPEAEEFVGKVREKKMGELFANVKIDVQAMRREVAEAEQKLAETGQKLAVAEQKIEAGIGIFIENCQEFGLSEMDTLTRLTEKLKLNKEEAESSLNKYWKK